MSSRPNIAVFDWDGTVCAGFTILRWAEYLSVCNRFNPNQLEVMYSAIRDFEQRSVDYMSLVHIVAEAYAGGVKGVPSSEIHRLAKRFVAKELHWIYPYARVVIPWLSHREIKIVVVTGSPQEVIEAASKELPIGEIFGLSVDVDSQGHLTGHISRNPGSKKAKDEIIAGLKKKNELVFAFGNSEADLPLLRAANMPVLIREGPESFAECESFASIDPRAGDHTELLKMLGSFA